MPTTRTSAVLDEIRYHRQVLLRIISVLSNLLNENPDEQTPLRIEPPNQPEPLVESQAHAVSGAHS